MLDRFDQHELLDLIEGELDAGAARALRERLAGDAHARALVEGMIRDRAALRGLGHPELPRDFVARLEPLLARPMLIELQPQEPTYVAKPGEFRRRVAAIRQTRRIRWGRLSAAAVLLVATLVGLWAAVNGLLAPAGSGNRAGLSLDDSLMTRADGPSPLVPEEDAAAVLTEPGTRHHYRPLPLPVDASSLAVASSSNVATENIAPPPPEGAAAPAHVMAEFAIVVRSDDAASVEQALERAMSGTTERSALVRNFSFAEAQRLAAAARLGNPERDGAPEPPAIASASGAQRDRVASAAWIQLAGQVRDQLRARSAAASASGPQDASGRIAGDAVIQPALESQLDFSSRGATHTVAIPASDLREFIERLSLEEGQATILEMLPKRDPLDLLRPDVAPAANAPGAAKVETQSGALRWLSEGPRVRQALAQLSPARADAIILVPVIVRTE